MAIECPEGHGRQNVIVNITADGSNPIKMSDVVAKRLACGCVVGGEEYEQFRQATAEIEVERQTAIKKINEVARKKKGSAYKNFVALKRGDEHAE